MLSAEKFLSGKKILVTAGGTRENIDPVRYIGNYSSGKMGIAFADAAFGFGAETVLISTIEIKKPYKVKKVDSALEMLDAVKAELKKADTLIMAAAVADFRPEKIAENKIKKDSGDSIILKLVKIRIF